MSDTAKIKPPCKCSCHRHGKRSCANCAHLHRAQRDEEVNA